ncbi:hypothetical protein ACN6LC_007054 [Streptomyces violaceoruber]|uniref:hypothetical protein n=1 Tax=Streptomyces violaceoruber group TaxID=2867121 RepID=UPI0036585F11
MDKTSRADHRHDAAAQRLRFIPPSRAHLACELPAPFPELLDQLTYATLDDCQQCRPVLLDRVADDARATLELVLWACFITSETYCGIPSQLVAGDEASDVPFRASATFRTLARQYGAHGRIKDTVCIHRTAAQRREAADTAVTLVAGLSRWSTDFLHQ